MKRTFLTGFILLISVFISSAQAPGRNMAKEHGLELQLQGIDSSLVPVFHAGTVAMDAQNYPVADSLYSIVYEKAPSFEPVVRRLGTIKASLGNTQTGIELCEKAVELNRSSDNIVMLASVLVNAGGPPNLNRAATLLNEGINLPGADDFEYTSLRAQIASELNQVDTFISLANYLLEKHPENMVSHYFGAIAAAQEEKWEKAEKEILVAKSMGLSENAVQTFLDSGVHSKVSSANYTKLFLWVLLFWAIGFVVLYLLGILLSTHTLKLLERQFRSNSTTELAPALRSIYRFLINTAGIYYYISLPIILVLVIGLVIGIFYLFLMIGRIPIQLMLILLVGACITIYGMIRSLLVKGKFKDPGRELKESDAPGLFALTREVANTMGTRPVDEIRITPETDLAVYETGSWREKFRDNGKRILILGTGVLKDFKQNDFRAVLAHEYGHFANRDTAGGAVALRVRKDMHNYLVALYYAGQTVWWNMAFQFLRLYDFIFRRISNGATRLQEILADRVAAQTYGDEAFRNGLTYVVKRNIEFVKLANLEIEDAKKVNRPFNNLYDLSATENQTFEEEVTKALNRKTSEDDTHPSPVDRFRFIEGIGPRETTGHNPYVRELFADWNAITAEMTKNIEDSWKQHG